MSSLSFSTCFSAKVLLSLLLLRSTYTDFMRTFDTLSERQASRAFW